MLCCIYTYNVVRDADDVDDAWFLIASEHFAPYLSLCMCFDQSKRYCCIMIAGGRSPHPNILPHPLALCVYFPLFAVVWMCRRVCVYGFHLMAEWWCPGAGECAVEERRIIWESHCVVFEMFFWKSGEKYDECASNGRVERGDKRWQRLKGVNL